MQEIIKKINEKLKPSGWYDHLRIFLDSSDFSDIIAELKKKVEVEKQRFCPALNTAFRFMEDIKFSKIKAVIFIDYACNRLDQADGVPLSTLQSFHDRIPTYLFQSIDGKFTHDVNKWVKQGMLIVPLSVTSRIDGKAHKKIWEPLLMRIIESINKFHPSVPILLIGSDTLKYEEDLVSPYIRCLELKSPIDDKNWHIWMNDILISQNKSQIIW